MYVTVQGCNFSATKQSNGHGSLCLFWPFDLRRGRVGVLRSTEKLCDALQRWLLCERVDTGFLDTREVLLHDPGNFFTS